MKIAIAGYGLEGKVSFTYWKNLGNDVTIVDECEAIERVSENAKTMVGKDALSKLNRFDLIIRSPGINPRKLPYGDKVWSATNEFFERCAEKKISIIGVTGTKGKGTTCSLIYSILEAAGKDVYLVGNIGAPALKILPKLTKDSIVVYELSSFQLWDAKRSPHVAVILGIEPDHLDVHDSMEDYVHAKGNIGRFQNTHDILAFNENNEISKKLAEKSSAEKVSYPFSIGEFEKSIKLPGKHNIENASAAIAAVQEYAVNSKIIAKGLSNFHGLDHRLKFVAEKNGVKYYDDSIATTPGSAIAAINSFDVPKILLLGGHEKGSDYTELIEKCTENDVQVIAYGANRDHLNKLSNESGATCYTSDGNMQTIVKTAANIANSGSVVILSPAAASFDMFKNYKDRGEQFIAAVKSLESDE